MQIVLRSLLDEPLPHLASLGVELSVPLHDVCGGGQAEAAWGTLALAVSAPFLRALTGQTTRHREVLRKAFRDGFAARRPRGKAPLHVVALHGTHPA